MVNPLKVNNLYFYITKHHIFKPEPHDDCYYRDSYEIRNRQSYYHGLSPREQKDGNYRESYDHTVMYA